MKRILSLLALIVLSMQVLFAQGVNFEKLSFQQALEKAAKEDKLIFIDCYNIY